MKFSSFIRIAGFVCFFISAAASANTLAAAENVDVLKTKPGRFADALAGSVTPIPLVAAPVVVGSGSTVTSGLQDQTRFVLGTGQPIHEALAAWSKTAGWHLIWYPSVSWKNIREASFAGLEITAAVSRVIDILRDEGKPVVLRVSEGNRVMEVMSTEIKND